MTSQGILSHPDEGQDLIFEEEGKRK